MLQIHLQEHNRGDYGPISECSIITRMRTRTGTRGGGGGEVVRIEGTVLP